LLELEQDAVRGLVLRQPSLLARASDGLQSKVTAYADIFGEDVGQVGVGGGVRGLCFLGGGGIGALGWGGGRGTREAGGLGGGVVGRGVKGGSLVFKASRRYP
jgi:hypothetical protein